MNFFKNLTNVFRKKKKEPEKIEEKKVLEKKEPEKIKPVSIPQPKKKVSLVEEELARAKAREIILDAKDQALETKKQAEEETKKIREELSQKAFSFVRREEKILGKEKEFEKKLNEVETIRKEEVERLERIAKLTRNEAKELILKRLENDLTEYSAKMIIDAEEKSREEADQKSKEILVNVMQKAATDYVAEYTVSQVELAKEEMKGRIIGKEGRNIRAFEKATGVDVDLDEEGVIRLSSFDSVRREIARVALKKLIADGRIQPVRIEEIVERTKQDIEKIMFEEGQKLAREVGVYNLSRSIIDLLGRFKYRFSYGQNMIAHTLEETKLGIALAQEVGANVNTVRLGCLLHDIGKIAIDEEGSHVKIGVELLKKHGIPQTVIDCVAQHHEDIPFTSIESMIVNIADSISGARPGARFEDYQKYVQRLTDLEDMAKSFKGVKEAYAFQAGRELRVIVAPAEVSDAKAKVLAHQVRGEIEKKRSFPGQIKVTVIREIRVVETTK
ncbi:ribonuclease Y [Candidatus Microgenomates bacterium]|nr:ribonuclease Y [Candidatus Microgenomates bacterium]